MFGFGRKKKKISMRRNSSYANTALNSNVNNVLREGDEGEQVEVLQKMLMSIVHVYPDIPVVTLDGKYNSETRNAVESFQKLNGIQNTGVVDKITWDRLNLIYEKKDQIKSIEKISFKNQDIRKERNLNLSDNVLKQGSKGRYVFRLQEYLRRISEINPNISNISLDGIFGCETKNAVIEFQKEFGIDPTGIVDEITWDKLYEEYIR